MHPLHHQCLSPSSPSFSHALTLPKTFALPSSPPPHVSTLSTTPFPRVPLGMYSFHHTPFITPPPSFFSHAPSFPLAFHYSSPFIFLTCTLSITHISLLLPLRSFHMRPLHHTHFITLPPLFFSRAPSPPHTFHYFSPFILLTCTLSNTHFVPPPLVLFTCTLFTTHISLLLPLRSFHIHPFHYTHFVTAPPSFFSHAPSPPHTFHYSSPFILLTYTLSTTHMYMYLLGPERMYTNIQTFI